MSSTELRPVTSLAGPTFVATVPARTRTASVPEHGETDSVHSQRVIARLRVAGVLLLVFLACMLFCVSKVAAQSTDGGTGTASTVQQALNSDSPSTAPLLALTGACTALVGALGIVIRAFVKGDIAPRASTVREEELIKQSAALVRLLEDAARREDVFYRNIGIHGSTDGGGGPR